MMNLLETLSLAMSLKVELALGNDKQIVAEPKGRITTDLRVAIHENLDALKDHLKRRLENDPYALLTDLTVARVSLVLRDGQLFAKPKRLAQPFEMRIKENKQFLIDMLALNPDEKITTVAEAVMLVRSRFETKPHEPEPIHEWVDPKKAAFYRGEAS